MLIVPGQSAPSWSKAINCSAILQINSYLVDKY